MPSLSAVQQDWDAIRAPARDGDYLVLRLPCEWHTAVSEGQRVPDGLMLWDEDAAMVAALRATLEERGWNAAPVECLYVSDPRLYPFGEHALTRSVARPLWCCVYVYRPRTGDPVRRTRVATGLRPGQYRVNAAKVRPLP